VVGDLEDRRPLNETPPEQNTLRCGFDVPRKQETHITQSQSQNYRAVIALRVRVHQGLLPARKWVQKLGSHWADTRLWQPTAASLKDTHTLTQGATNQSSYTRFGVETRGKPELIDLERLKHCKESLEVVGMGMGHKDLVQVNDAKTPQSRKEPLVTNSEFSADAATAVNQPMSVVRK